MPQNRVLFPQQQPLEDAGILSLDHQHLSSHQSPPEHCKQHINLEPHKHYHLTILLSKTLHQLCIYAHCHFSSCIDIHHTHIHSPPTVILYVSLVHIPSLVLFIFLVYNPTDSVVDLLHSSTAILQTSHHVLRFHVVSVQIPGYFGWGITLFSSPVLYPYSYLYYLLYV